MIESVRGNTTVLGLLYAQFVIYKGGGGGLTHLYIFGSISDLESIRPSLVVLF